jgi:ribosomal protein S18 acetylase RimI-like enzyme
LANAEEEAMRPFHLEPLSEEHRPWAHKLLLERWGSTLVVSRGNLIDAALLQGFVAVDDSGPIGLATFCVRDDACEIATLDSQVEGKGVGSALIIAVQRIAQFTGCRRLWLITTNDNTPALRFYQKRGFHLAAIHPNALEQSRRLKPEIPLVGQDGIPLRDEIELEIRLDEAG